MLQGGVACAVAALDAQHGHIAVLLRADVNAAQVHTDDAVFCNRNIHVRCREGYHRVFLHEIRRPHNLACSHVVVAAAVRVIRAAFAAFFIRHTRAEQGFLPRRHAITRQCIRSAAAADFVGRSLQPPQQQFAICPLVHSFQRFIRNFANGAVCQVHQHNLDAFFLHHADCQHRTADMHPRQRRRIGVYFVCLQVPIADVQAGQIRHRADVFCLQTVLRLRNFENQPVYAVEGIERFAVGGQVADGMGQIGHPVVRHAAHGVFAGFLRRLHRIAAHHPVEPAAELAHFRHAVLPEVQRQAVIIIIICQHHHATHSAGHAANGQLRRAQLEWRGFIHIVRTSVEGQPLRLCLREQQEHHQEDKQASGAHGNSLPFRSSWVRHSIRRRISRFFSGIFRIFRCKKGTAARAVPFAFYSPDNAAESSCSAAERFVCSSIVLIPVISWLE